MPVGQTWNACNGPPEWKQLAPGPVQGIQSPRDWVCGAFFLTSWTLTCVQVCKHTYIHTYIHVQTANLRQGPRQVQHVNMSCSDFGPFSRHLSVHISFAKHFRCSKALNPSSVKKGFAWCCYRVLFYLFFTHVSPNPPRVWGLGSLWSFSQGSIRAS